MKTKLVALLLIAILSISNASQIQLSAEQMQYLNDLKSSDFGKNLFNAIQLELKADGNSAIQKILDLLTQIENDLNSQQKQRDDQHQVDQANCQTDISDITTDLNNAKAQKLQDQADLSKAQDQRDDSTKAISTATTARDQFQDNLNTKQQIRNQQNADYKKSFDDYTNDIKVLAEGREQIKVLLKGSSFIEKKYELKTKPVLLEFKNALKDLQSGSSKGIRTFSNFFLKLLQDPGVQSDQALVTKIVDLIDNLIRNLNDTLQKINQTEDSRQQNFNQDKAQLEGEIKAQQAIIDTNTILLAQANSDITRLNKSISDQTDIIKNKTDQLNLKQKECTDLNNSYTAQTKNYNDEIKVIHEVQAIFRNIQQNQGQVDILKNVNVNE